MKRLKNFKLKGFIWLFSLLENVFSLQFKDNCTSKHILILFHRADPWIFRFLSVGKYAMKLSNLHISKLRCILSISNQKLMSSLQKKKKKKKHCSVSISRICAILQHQGTKVRVQGGRQPLQFGGFQHPFRRPRLCRYGPWVLLVTSFLHGSKHQCCHGGFT